jgi:hypothetical protein
MKHGKRTSGDLIDAIVDNMRQNLEELKYATLAPSRYTVYLSSAEHARIEGIIPRLQAEATRALDEELARINRPRLLRGLARRVTQFAGGRRPPLENAGPRWHVEFFAGHRRRPGRRGRHRRALGSRSRARSRAGRRRAHAADHHDAAGRHEFDKLAHDQPAGSSSGVALVHARLSYRDNLGDHAFDVVADQATIGRGGQTHPVDVRLSTTEDVSREHARIRRDGVTGQFYLIDLSTLGTTLNGRHVPRGVEERGGVKRENGAETALPARARIGLADTVFLDFEQVER